MKRRKVVNVHEAKTQLSKLLARAEKGDEIVIARSGRPVAMLVRIPPQPKKRVFGQDRGKVDMKKFEEAWKKGEEMLRETWKEWYNSPIFPR